jgi:hypothetical protein
MRGRTVPSYGYPARALLPLRHVPQSNRQRVRSVGVDIAREHFLDQRGPKYRRSSPLAERGFCVDCGSPLTLIYDGNRPELALHAGTLDAPEQFQPLYNYGASQRLGWVCCGIDLPDLDTDESW